MSLNLDVNVVRIIGAVIILIGAGGWWYMVNKMGNKKP